MHAVGSFAATVIALALITAVMEFLLPAGNVKNTASTAAGLVFLSAVCNQIFGIIRNLGV